LLKERGQKYDVVDAVLAAQRRNPAGAARAVQELQGWVQRDDWQTILPAFARCVRITRDQKQIYQLDEKLFQEKEEKDLFAAVQKAERQLGESFQGGRESLSIDKLFHAFLPMMPAINAFFDKVLVMAEDRAVRTNRLGLLQRIVALSRDALDLSKLEGF